MSEGAAPVKSISEESSASASGSGDINQKSTSAANVLDDNIHIGLRANILQILFRLLDEAPYASINVSSICKVANISRSTFYRLFSSKYDVFNWFMRATLRSSFSQIGRFFSWSDGLIRFVRVLDVNRNLTRQALSVESGEDCPRKAMKDYMAVSLEHTVANRLNLADGAGQLPDLWEFQIRAFVRSTTAAIIDWVDTDQPPYSLVDNLLLIIPPKLFELLNVDSAGEAFSLESLRSEDHSFLVQLVVEEKRTEF